MFRLSPCIGLVTSDPTAAADFYVRHLGMGLAHASGTQLLAGSLRLFIDPGMPRPLVFELATPRLGDARPILRGLGFDEVVWTGVGGSNLVRDPFGLVVSIYQANEEPLVDVFVPVANHLVRPCLGALVPNPKEAATFYSRVLDDEAVRLSDASFALESGGLRLRFRQGPLPRPALWLRQEAPISELRSLGFRAQSEPGVFLDPFGLMWCMDIGERSSFAVVELAS